MNKYVVFEPWHVRVREWLARKVICPVRGHRWKAKMYDLVCQRCFISTPREDLMGEPMCAQFVDYIRHQP